MAQKPPAEAEAISAPVVPKESILKTIPIIPILNTLTILGSFGFLYYTKLVFKKPVITEEGERAKLASLFEKAPKGPTVGMIDFETMTVNLGSQDQGKLHYVTLGISMEIRDRDQQDLISAIRPRILDYIVATLGKKQFHELTTVQGRYNFHAQILQEANRLTASMLPTSEGENLISEVYFTQFIVQ